MKVLVVGNGGREHALVWKIAQSSRVTRIFVAPGNAGTATESKTENVDISSDDIPALVKFAQQKGIELTVVGPEAPLVAGIVDAFQKAKLRVFGPSKAAAQLEGSKVFCKNLLRQADVPTADYHSAGCSFGDRPDRPAKGIWHGWQTDCDRGATRRTRGERARLYRWSDDHHPASRTGP
jgi:phosphoribosylamine-glycine ligase